ncbi:MAG: quinone oxidoreductase [Pseudorhodoplanes sp.]|nr:Quinone oxidoreductase 1 [Pseudorhodoplanes sp.]MBW7950068.1 quinone oxidoreductase [Pseudorhodoplanes sp.]MCQ3942821.1 quinone oxidoreductase [Alphaproteobacteria bacterium]GIK79439.1 MAG: quinone oxidoreductase [Alphaproteobacteria bacterium]
MAKAVRFEKTGDESVLGFVDVDLPPPGAGEVRVKHTAIGVNFIDIYQRSGVNPVPLPSGLGLEAAGVVVAVGSGVSGFKTGDRVAYTGAIGAYATERNIDASKLVHVPAAISDEIAASIMLKGMTACFLVTKTYPVQRGDVVVVHAAAGGVGSLLCQWAKQLGAVVVGTVGSQAKVAIAKENGCDHVLLYPEVDVAKAVRELSGGKGAAVVYDSIGKDTYLGSLDSLRRRGMLVNFGNASGPIPPFDPRILAGKGSLYLTRPTLPDYVATREELDALAGDVFAAVAQKRVAVRIGRSYPLDQVATAHRDLEGRRTTGSNILIP